MLDPRVPECRCQDCHRELSREDRGDAVLLATYRWPTCWDCHVERAMARAEVVTFAPAALAQVATGAPANERDGAEPVAA